MKRLRFSKPAAWFLAILVNLPICAGAMAQGLKRPTPTPFPQAPQVANVNLPRHMRVRVDQDLVTAEIRNMPVQMVMEELAARTGIVFEVSAQNEELVSLSLLRVPLGEAIARILGDGNSIFYYGNGEDGKPRVQYVRSLARPAAGAQPSLRYIGAGTVTKTGDDTVDNPEQAVRVLTESKNLELRQKAIEVLVASKGASGVEALTAVINDESPEIRAGAIEGLASLSARSALPEILKRLKDVHPGVRHSAVKAVALLGESKDLNELRPLVKDRDNTVAAAALIAIQQLSMRRP